MLPNGFTRTALAASLLLGTSALALAQTHPGEATAPAAPAVSSAPTSPTATPAEPRKATQEEHQKATQAEPNKAGQADHEKATQAEPQKAEPNRPGATKPSEAAGRGNSAEPGKAPANAAGGNKADASAPASRTTVNLTTVQKTEIHNTIISDHGAPRANHLSISLSVGVAVPEAVEFAPLPPRIVEIEPTWRGYDYFLYGEQIVIIEPGTRRIVAILVG